MDVGLGLPNYSEGLTQGEILASKEGSPEKVEFLSKDLTEAGGDTALSQREVKSKSLRLPDEMIEKILECLIASYGSCNTSYELRTKLSDIVDSL